MLSRNSAQRVNYYFNRQSYLLYLLNAASVIDGHCVIKSMTINDLLTTK